MTEVRQGKVTIFGAVFSGLLALVERQVAHLSELDIQVGEESNTYCEIKRVLFR